MIKQILAGGLAIVITLSIALVGIRVLAMVVQ
jgi:hypothetical protein